MSLSVYLHLNSETATPKVHGPWDSQGHTHASVMYGDLTINLRDRDGAQRAEQFADALNEAARRVLDETEGPTP